MSTSRARLLSRIENTFKEDLNSVCLVDKTVSSHEGGERSYAEWAMTFKDVWQVSTSLS